MKLVLFGVCFDCIARLLSERKQAVADMISSTPCLAEGEEVLKFVRECESNSGTVQVAFNFIRFLSLHYDHKWYVWSICSCIRVHVGPAWSAGSCHSKLPWLSHS